MPFGLHARPANVWVKEAARFKSTIKVIKGHKQVDGKRLLPLLTLGVKQGESMDIIVEGEDEKEAIEALRKVVESDFAD